MKCPNCNIINNKSDAVYCHNCGIKLPRKSHKGCILAIVILVIIAAISTTIYLANESSYSDNSNQVRPQSYVVDSAVVVYEEEYPVIGSSTVVEESSEIIYDNISGIINNVWSEHNVYQDEQKGMKIHVKFYVYNMLNVRGSCVAYFYYENGNVLKDFNNSYNTADGNVSTGEDFNPNYESTEYSDFVLFLPYSELHLSSEGRTNLKAFVVLWTYPPLEQPKQLATSDYFNFWYGS